MQIDSIFSIQYYPGDPIQPMTVSTEIDNDIKVILKQQVLF